MIAFGDKRKFNVYFNYISIPMQVYLCISVYLFMHIYVYIWASLVAQW